MALGEWLLGLVRETDVRLYTFLNGFAGDWLLDRVVAEEERDQLLKGGMFMALYWYAWFRPDPAQNRRRIRIVTGVAAALGALAVARLLATVLPFRVRPMFVHGLPHMAFAIPIRPNMEAWSAFPSDTATFFFALAIGMIYVERAFGRWMLLVAATWISIPRMYIGLHYLSDILAGALVAALVTRLAMRSEWIKRRIAAPIVEAADTHSGVFYAAGFLVSMEMANLFDATRGLMHGLAVFLQRASHREMAVISVALLITAAAVAGVTWRRRSGRRRATLLT